MSDVRMGVLGCAGRMGQALLREISATDGAVVTAGIERAGHEAIGQDLGAQAGLPALDIAVGDDLRALMTASDVVLDFTTPEATVAAAIPAVCSEGGQGVADAFDRMARYAGKAPWIMGDNCDTVCAEMGTSFSLESGSVHLL